MRTADTDQSDRLTVVRAASVAHTFGMCIPVPSLRPTTVSCGPVLCAACPAIRACLPAGLDGSDIETFSAFARLKRKIARGAALFRTHDPLKALYSVRTGAFKTGHTSRGGHEKVTGFYLPGDTLGLDAINGGTHGFHATALEDSEVCVIRYRELESMAGTMPAVRRQLLRTLSADISRDQGLMLVLGAMSADERLAAFLLSLARRYRRLGYAPNRFVLPMTRWDIGSYLGLAAETVSRQISSFQRDQLISVDRHEVQLIDVTRLHEMAGL